LAFVELTIVANGGAPEPVSQLVRVVRPHRDWYGVIAAHKITGAAHLIPEEPVSLGEQNNAWIVNSQIDMATWNDVYWIEKKELTTMKAG
jgi:hypothetical protein